MVYSTGSGVGTSGDPGAGAGTDGGYPHVQYRSPSGEEGPVVDITPMAAYAAATPASTPYVLTPRNGRGTAALVLGCMAVVCTGGLFFLFPIGLLFGLLAVLLGRSGRDRASWGGATNGSAATAGLTLGAVALFLGALLTAAAVWVSVNYDVGAIRDCVRDQSSTVDAGHCLLDVFDQS